MAKNGLIVVLLILVIVLVIHGQTAAKAQTGSVPGISLGMGIWAVLDPGLQAQAVSMCASSGDAIACVNAQLAITKDAQQRGLAFMNDVYSNYWNARTSLSSRNLWFNPGK